MVNDERMKEPMPCPLCGGSDRTVEGAPAILYGHTLNEAVERLLAVMDEETCCHDGEPIEHSIAVRGAIDIVRARLDAALARAVADWDEAHDSFEGRRR
jgi:hypothetical protein